VSTSCQGSFVRAEDTSWTATMQMQPCEGRNRRLTRALGIWQARLKESEHALINCNKELSEVKLHLKMAQQEAEDTRQLLQQSQLALERDRRRWG